MTASSADQKSLLKHSLSGVFAASLTPLKPDLSCDVQAMAEHCKELINRGCSGVAIFGTTGEGSSFSVHEKKKVMKSLIDSGIAPEKLIIAVSSCPIPDVVELAQEALKLGCAALLIVPPFFYKSVDEAGVAAFYREVILRVGNPALRIILYHIPQFSGVPFTLNLIRRLLEEFPEQVFGLKESEGNLLLVGEILKQFPHFNVYAGNEVQLSEAARLGAAGSISGMANLFPELLQSLYAFGKDPSKRNDKEKIDAIRQLVRHYPFIAAFKGVMEIKKGSAWHALRPPLMPLDKDQQRALYDELSKIEKIT